MKNKFVVLATLITCAPCFLPYSTQGMEYLQECKNLIEKPHIFSFARYDLEDNTDDPQGDSEELAETGLCPPSPEQPIFAFSDQPIIFYFFEKVVFSKAPVIILCLKGVEIPPLTLPKDSKVLQDDKAYQYIKEKIRFNDFSLGSAKAELHPLAGSIYSDTTNLFSPVIDFDQPIVVTQSNCPYKIIFKLEGYELNYNLLTFNAMVFSVEPQILQEWIAIYLSDPLEGTLSSFDLRKTSFKSCKEEAKAFNKEFDGI